MTYYELSRPVSARLPDPPQRQLIPGEEAVLEMVAAAGRRAADWLRSVPGPERNWVAGDLADAVQEATAGLDPGDRDEMDRWGTGGVPEPLRERLDVAAGLSHADWLSPQDAVFILAVTGCVLGMPQVLATDPVGALGKELPALCAVLDWAVEAAAGRP
ncbi:hypothetical protein ACWDR3_32810 [Streptomyces sp. NPDC001002]